jgi:ribosomal protein S18 acetylase RimI-like enzyme
VLNEVMRRFQAEGLLWAALAVNIDNDSALGLYQLLGFERFRRRTSSQKVAPERGCH